MEDARAPVEDDAAATEAGIRLARVLSRDDGSRCDRADQQREIRKSRSAFKSRKMKRMREDLKSTWANKAPRTRVRNKTPSAPPRTR